MGASVVTRPIKSLCRYNAAGNPIVYKLQRRDSAFHAVSASGGNLQIQITGVDYTAFFQAGNIVYVDSESGTDYTGQGTVVSRVFAGGNTLIIISGLPAFVATSTGYINNLSKRTDYRLSIWLRESDSNALITPEMTYQPDSTGFVSIDVSSMVRSHLSADWTNVVSDMNDSGASLRFKLVFQEYYDGAMISAPADDTEWIVGVLATLQLFNNILTLDRNPDGGNMLAYQVDNLSGKWLTKFERVPYWRGYPFTLSFLWPNVYGILKKKVVQKDAAGTIVDTFTTFFNTRVDDVVRFGLQDGIQASTKTIEVSILDNADVQICSTLYIDVLEPCINPVHLVWKNSLGGDSFWQFEYNQEYEYGFRDGIKTSRLTVFANNLKISEWEALNDMLDPSPIYAANITDLNMDDSVVKTHYRDLRQIYMLNQAGTIKAGVVAIAAGQKTKTRKVRHMFEMEFELPQTFNI